MPFSELQIPEGLSTRPEIGAVSYWEKSDIPQRQPNFIGLASAQPILLVLVFPP